MKMAVFLKVNGSLGGDPRGRHRFQLPEKNIMLNSLRFGHHAFVLGRTMQILPLGDPRPLEWRDTGVLGDHSRKVLNRLSDRQRYFLSLLQ